MNAEAEAIRASGLFDPRFYLQTYGHWLRKDQDPLDHFLETGLAQGHLPSADFDPVLYKVLVPECRNDNPLLHSHSAGEPFRPPPMRELFQKVAAAMSFRGNAGQELEIERNRAFAREAAAAGEIPFSAGGSRYLLKVPGPRTFLERLRSDRPFAYVRLPHGFWDALWLLEKAEDGLAGDPRAQTLSPAERRALAMRLCAALRSIHGGFAPYFIEEVLAGIPVHAAHPDFFRGVSFKGYPTFDEDVFGGRRIPPPEELGRIFARHFRPEETLYDGTLWKRLLIAGHLEELPALCHGRPVVLIASEPFADLDARWALEDFTHLEIPFTLTQWQRWDLLARASDTLAAACARSVRPPVVITRCGASLAWWLITRLFNHYPRVFYLELGQALGGWFFDALESLGAPWAKIYAPSIIANCNLEPYYRARFGKSYEEWRAGLNDPPPTGVAPRQRDSTATGGNGGGMPRNDSENTAMGPEELIAAIEKKLPGLLDGEVNDEAAGALLMQAFQIIQERLDRLPEGVLKVRGLGKFRVRNVERMDGPSRMTRRVISLNIGEKDDKAG